MDGRARLRSPAAIAAVALLLAAAVGAVGFALERASSTIGGAAAAVVAVSSDLADGGTVNGSGVIVTPTGDVVTSYHNVSGALIVHVRVPASSARYVAAIAGLDPVDDLALLQLENVSGLASVSLTGSTMLSPGDHVTAVGATSGGAPLEVQLAVAQLNQTATALHPGGTNPQTLTGLAQLSGQIPAYACGGALVDSNGDLAGIDTVGGGPPGQQASANAAFATPAAEVAAVVHDIVTGAPNPNILQGGGAFLGVDVHDSLSPSGAAIAGVEPDSPAQAAGLAAGDIIVAFGSTQVDSVATLHNAVQHQRPGARVVVVWLDPGGTRHAVTVQLVTGSAY